MPNTAQVTVPATTANIGPGFDCLGAAFTLYNHFKFTPTDQPLTITISGSEANRLSTGPDNLVYTAFVALYQHLNKPIPNIHIDIDLHVPLSRGLGSSSTAIVGGLVGANLLAGSPLSQTQLATLATDRALLLYGVPGTGKSWVSEHLAAAISGDSTLLIQGTAGTSEEAIRYGWNYAELLARGPSLEAIVQSPLMAGMSAGKIVRVEELTRMPADVQDTLITVLSEKLLPIAELGTEIQASKGFNLIATANNRDKGVNELPSALKRRFNTVILPVPNNADEEIQIVQQRVESLGRALELPAEPPALEEIRRVVTIFRELRTGITEDGKTKVKKKKNFSYLLCSFELRKKPKKKYTPKN